MIKNHITKNEYYYCGSDLWVRNFTKPNVKPYDVNTLVPEAEMPLFLYNEIENNKKLFPALNVESFEHKNIAIISSGYNFQEIHKLLDKNITVLAVNNVPNLWENRKKFDYYVINNPYKESLKYLRNNWTKCIASRRTNCQFLDRYNGIVYTYSPTTDRNYSGIKTENDCYIDDYRNPICACIGISYLFKVKKLLFLCCEELSEVEKPGMIKGKKYWYYPQQEIVRDLIDGNLFWLKKQNIKIGINSYELEYKNAEYIEKDGLNKFFEI